MGSAEPVRDRSPANLIEADVEPQIAAGENRYEQPSDGLPRTVDALQPAWERVRRRMQAEVGDLDFRTWLSGMVLGGIDGDELTIRLPTRFVRDYVRGHYAERLQALWQSEDPTIRHIDIRFAGGSRGTETPDVPTPVLQAIPARVEIGTAPQLTDRPTDAALDTRFTFDSFVVGKPNEFAHACARRVAAHPAVSGFNPLFLYGGVGLGKTHLMHAIAWELTMGRPALPGAAAGRPVNVAYMSAERFMYNFIAAIRSQATMEFKERFRSVDVLMIDDLQFLIGKDATQEEFFHTFNALVEAGKQIVVSADKSPSDLSGLEERVRTRLAVGMVADLHATTFELRLSILETKAARAGVPVSSKVMEFLAHKITTNIRELEGALNRLIAHANLFGRQITLETAHEVLHDVLRAHDRRVTIEEIQKRVAEHYSIRLADMSSPRRARAVARPRQVAMYLSKQLTSRSLPEIGRKFGNRDHTTVMHAVSKIGELMALEASFAEDVELLRRMLES